MLTRTDDGQSFQLKERVNLEAYTAVEALNGNQLIIGSEKGIMFQ